MNLHPSIKQLALASALLASLASAPVLAQTAASAAQARTDTSLSVDQAGQKAGRVFGAVYAPAGQVAADRVQVIYYRQQVGGGAPRPAANVYIDGHYQTSLLPNGYTTFCVKPGVHTLGAYQNDAPQYRGKTQDIYRADLKAGTTYFLKVSEDGTSGAPVAVPRPQAEQELQGAHAQVHALSRAATTEACRVTLQPAAAQYKDYTLQGDLLFAFGKSGYRDITAAGQDAIAGLVAQMQREGTTTKRIVVVGHADQIGSAAAAEALGLQRAQTVRRVLIERGLPGERVEVQSAGNTEPVVSDCKGSRQQLIACNAPNRRVVVRADVTSATAN